MSGAELISKGFNDLTFIPTLIKINNSEWKAK